MPVRTFTLIKLLIFPDEGEIKKALTPLSTNNYDLLRNSIPKNFHFKSVIYHLNILKNCCIGIITLGFFQ